MMVGWNGGKKETKKQRGVSVSSLFLKAKLQLPQNLSQATSNLQQTFITTTRNLASCNKKAGLY
jgi:hypothetical protein